MEIYYNILFYPKDRIDKKKGRPQIIFYFFSFFQYRRYRGYGSIEDMEYIEDMEDKTIL